MSDGLWKCGLTALFGLLSGALGWAAKQLRARRKSQETERTALREGMLALLHSELYRRYDECQQKGFASVDDLQNLEYLYHPYHALGGNGTGTELYGRVTKMPTSPPNAAQEIKNAG